MNISANKSLIYCLLFSFASPLAYSAPVEAWGRVNMQGAIIETACAIDTLSRDQTIEMGTLPLSQIARDGRGLPRLFTVHLVRCSLIRPNASLSNWRHFKITFDGRNDSGLFAVDGQAKGVAIEIIDDNGNVALPGSPLPASRILAGDMRLNYSLRLVSNQQVLRPGNYTSALRFKMDYY
ncbi:type 1 fimbrial protein [Serratia fonticola]|uniref:fimbrial protein n=1 Tax=Serratia fonticola TaxID=47917 RepID=UPI0015763240|nr:fimbrial protein [Serratia fonticola]NTY86589.1 type 1 fimbrial protein [Serratia fonticola]NTZ12474.1 type 1 fimbrial protein [Serratia fonticola]